MAKVLELTAAQGNYIFRFSHVVQFPEKIGEKATFNHQQRATFNKEIGEVYKALKRESEISRQKSKLFFGPAKWYDAKNAVPKGDDPSMAEDDGERYSLKDEFRHAAHPVTINSNARNGLFRIYYLLTHPDSKNVLGPGVQEELVWPVAEKVRCVKALETAIGLSENQTIKIVYDDDDAEPEAETPKEASKPTLAKPEPVPQEETVEA
jgi:hypothetical protein